MAEQFQNVMRNADLIGAEGSGLLASVLMSYLANVDKPGAMHVVLAFAALAAVVGAFLLVARAKVDPEWKGAAIGGGGIVCVVCFLLLSRLY